MKLRNGESVITVEFGLQWRGTNGRWFSEVFKNRADLETRRREVEPHATELSEHMRDRRTEYTRWQQTSPRASARTE